MAIILAAYQVTPQSGVLDKQVGAAVVAESLKVQISERTDQF